MQHDRVLKNWILTFWSHHLSPHRGSGTGLRSKITFDMFHIYCTSVCSCYHVAAFAIPLMCNMTMFWKSWILIFWGERGAAGKIVATMLLHSWFPLIWYATWSCSAKVKFDLLTLVSGEGGGAAGKIFATMLLHSWLSLILYAIWPCSEKVEF